MPFSVLVNVILIISQGKLIYGREECNALNSFFNEIFKRKKYLLGKFWNVPRISKYF